MHFHLPKPLHGWREFVGEVGIIVLGVLIALGAEQIVEEFHWRAEVSDARTEMAVELSDSIGQSIQRERLSPCINRRLDQISAIVSRASQSGRLPPVGMIGRPLYRTWVSSAWQSTVAGQTGSHFSSRELNRLGYIYDNVERASKASEQEMLAWVDLQSISGPGRPISPQETAELLRTVERARAWDSYLVVNSLLIRRLTAQLPLPYDQRTIAESASGPTTIDYCRLIGQDFPSDYGHSSFEDSARYAQGIPTIVH